MSLLAAQLRDAGEGEILLADGFDAAFLGLGTRPGQPTIAVYSWELCIELLLNDSAMSANDAEEHMNYNVAGAWMGDRTPIFVRLFDG